MEKEEVTENQRRRGDVKVRIWNYFRAHCSDIIEENIRLSDYPRPYMRLKTKRRYLVGIYLAKDDKVKFFVYSKDETRNFDDAFFHARIGACVRPGLIFQYSPWNTGQLARNAGCFIRLMNWHTMTNEKLAVLESDYRAIVRKLSQNGVE